MPLSNDLFLESMERNGCPISPINHPFLWQIQGRTCQFQNHYGRITTTIKSITEDKDRVILSVDGIWLGGFPHMAQYLFYVGQGKWKLKVEKCGYSICSICKDLPAEIEGELKIF